MLTRCPACETHFRVTAEQLKARSGRVRCGECQHVFNALDTLIEESVLVMAPPAPEPLPASSPPEREPATLPASPAEEIGVSPAPTFQVTAEAPEALAALPPEQLAEEPGAEAGTAETVESAYAAQATPDEAEAAAIAVPAQAPDTSEAAPAEGEAVASDIAEETPADSADWSEAFPEPAPPRRWPWVVGSAIAFVALSLQAAFAFRVELAVLVPQAKPALLALCELAACEVGLPMKVAMVGIEASDLHPGSGNAGGLTLTATLKNRAPFAQQFPHLELTLTDTADQVIARKVMAPKDYLMPKTPIAEGMPPNADIVVATGVEAVGMAASGYRLYLFYP